MMIQEIILESIGIILVLAVILDVLITTLRLTGSGIFSVRLTNRLWYLTLRSRFISTNHRLLSLVGFGIVLFSIVLWLALLWLGWVLIFSVNEHAVVGASTNMSAGFWERVYFVGYNMTTLGLGDYRPDGTIWQIATVLTAANGFFFITLIAAYLLPLVSAVGAKRQFAIYASSLGNTPVEIVTGAWNGTDFGALSQHLDNLGPSLTSLAQQHLAYPVIHCFHDQSRTAASAPSIAALGETWLLLRYGVAPEQRPDAVTLRVLEGALFNFLETLNAAFIEPEKEAPPLPDLDTLRQHGIPMVDDATFEEACSTYEKQRRLLVAQVQRDGWSWGDVTGHDPDYALTKKRS
jgi:hypothetical protein